MKKYSAFFLGPLAAMFFIIAAFQGPLVLQSIDSLSSLTRAFAGCAECLLALAPATGLAIIIGIPVFLLLRWIIHWELWSCLLGALLVIGSVWLLIADPVSSNGLEDVVAGRYLLALAVGTLSYGTVFWLLMTWYWEDDEEE